MWQPCARDSGNKIAASAHGMGSGGSAVDTMVIGCLVVERRAERFLSYLAIFPLDLDESQQQMHPQARKLAPALLVRDKHLVHGRTQHHAQRQDEGPV